MPQELQVLSDFYDLMHYLVGRIVRFPRHHRYSLGTDMEHRLQAILALLIRAKYAGPGDDRPALLRLVNVELEVLRFQLRLAKDLAALPRQSHGHAIQQVGQVRAQVGGWLRSIRPPQGEHP
jgi:hypothetical protein